MKIEFFDTESNFLLPDIPETLMLYIEYTIIEILTAFILPKILIGFENRFFCYSKIPETLMLRYPKFWLNFDYRNFDCFYNTEKKIESFDTRIPEIVLMLFGSWYFDWFLIRDRTWTGSSPEFYESRRQKTKNFESVLEIKKSRFFKNSIHNPDPEQANIPISTKKKPSFSFDKSHLFY